MSRPVFSATDDSYVRNIFGAPVAGVSVKVFTARTGGTQITDLLAVDDAGNVGAAIPGGILISDRDGLLPAFAGPDGGPVAVWVNTGQGGVRNLLRADATGGSGGGGSQFTSVLGKSSGSVTGADIVAATEVSTALSSKAAADLSNVDPSAGRSALQLGSAATRSVGQIASDPTLSGTYAQAAGDLSGTPATPTVAKIKGVALPATAPTAGQVLTATSGTAAGWSTPAAGAGDATTGAKGVVQLAGDLAGSATAPSVAKVNGVAVTGTPTAGQVLTAGSASGASWATPAAGAGDATTGGKGVVQLAGDLAGTAAAPTVPGLAAKAPLASPALTGTPTAPTATAGTSTTQLATTAFVSAAVTAMGAPVDGGNASSVYGGVASIDGGHA